MCQSPLTRRNKKLGLGYNKLTTKVPCGKCSQCTKAKLQAWLFRLNKELEISSNPLFVTLTYDEQNVPKSKSGLNTLKKKDIQDWFKKLRFHYSKISDKKIIYYIVGEYGSKTQRPHYHAILYNMDKIELINETWDKGMTYSPSLKEGGISYVLKYMYKPKSEFKDDKLKEFQLMSKGIGKNYLTKNVIKYHQQSTEFCFITNNNGTKMAMPEYYKNKIYTQDEKTQITMLQQGRADEADLQALKEYLKEYPHHDEKKARRNLELSKLNQRFDKRNEKL